MSDLTGNLMSDERAERIGEYTKEVLAQKEWLPPVAFGLALAAEALLRDRQARCELAAPRS